MDKEKVQSNLNKVKRMIKDLKKFGYARLRTVKDDLAEQERKNCIDVS